MFKLTLKSRKNPRLSTTQTGFGSPLGVGPEVLRTGPGSLEPFPIIPEPIPLGGPRVKDRAGLLAAIYYFYDFSFRGGAPRETEIVDFDT